MLVTLVPVFLLFGPLGEEFGWRGYALPRLQARFGALAASLLVGVAWAAWHTPLFFDPTSSYAQLPPMVFVARMVGLAVLFTWLVNRTGRSLLFPLLAHTVINASGQIWAAVPDPGTDAYQEQLLTAAEGLSSEAFVAPVGPGHAPIRAALQHVLDAQPRAGTDRRNARDVDRQCFI